MEISLVKIHTNSSDYSEGKAPEHVLCEASYVSDGKANNGFIQSGLLCITLDGNVHLPPLSLSGGGALEFRETCLLVVVFQLAK